MTGVSSGESVVPCQASRQASAVAQWRPARASSRAALFTSPAYFDLEMLEKGRAFFAAAGEAAAWNPAIPDRLCEDSISFRQMELELANSLHSPAQLDTLVESFAADCTRLGIDNLRLLHPGAP